jgi:GTP-binding protein Era
VVLIDTPGLHQARSLLNRRMVDIARSSLADADVALFMVDTRAGVTGADREIAEGLAAAKAPVVAVANKIDLSGKAKALPVLAELARILPDAELVPASAKNGAQLDVVLAEVVKKLPEGPRLYLQDEFTTESERSLVLELVREQIFLSTRDEVPYGVAVLLDEFTEKPERELTVVGATILVERENHKAIVIGSGGSMLKSIGSRARQEIEALLGMKVFLELFVRVEPDWSANPRRLSELGL